MMEDVAIIGGLIGVQLVFAGNAVLLSYLMSLGINYLTLVIFTSFATFLVLLPVAFYYERCKWPKKVSFKLLMQLLLLSFGGVTMFQSLFLKGINLTSPAMGTAMPNLAPGLIFIIAWIFRLEKVKLRCTYSRVKIIGTFLCVLGALTMSIMQSISKPTPLNEGTIQLSSAPPNVTFDRQKLIGCLYLLVAVLILSCNIVLQAFTLGDFPAPVSLCALTSFFGTFMTAAVKLLEDHEFKTGWPLVGVGDMIGYSLLAGSVTGICLSFNGWALEKRGPVLVSMFSPIGTVCSVFFSVVTLGDTINIGSSAGMLLMFTGLYFVLWAKGKEGYANGGDLDAEKPLLS
ncbi:WAT1-related protein At5g47470-like [Abrus precatorius]|uniref:WAT1-related protein n=1 Tax=Abrus precatorius TaxID=3816 RepID=A0A8B8K1Q3_ABRPR|nr:WAT1-related protein At5g47470-like [Abrus precatorius]